MVANARCFPVFLKWQHHLNFLKRIVAGRIQGRDNYAYENNGGLAGANMSMKLMNTLMRVYKEAERRGDTAVMERVMGYVGELADKAEDYQKKA